MLSFTKSLTAAQKLPLGDHESNLKKGSYQKGIKSHKSGGCKILSPLLLSV